MTRFSKTRLILPLVATLSGMAMAAGCLVAQTEMVQLRWKLPESSELRVETVQSLNLIQRLGNQTRRTTNATTTWMTWQVKAVRPDGTAEIANRIDRVAVRIEGNIQGKLVYDSDDTSKNEGPGAGEMERIFRPMIGSVTSMVMSPTGEIASIEIADATIEAVEASGSSQFMNRSTIERMIRDSTPAFPPELATGQSWSRQSPMPLAGLGSLVVDSTYTYRGTESVEGRELHRIDNEIRVSFQPEPSARNVELEVIDQSNRGKILFDNQAGRLVSNTVSQDLTMEIRAGGELITQNMQQQVTTRFSGE